MRYLMNWSQDWAARQNRFLQVDLSQLGPGWPGDVTNTGWQLWYEVSVQQPFQIFFIVKYNSWQDILWHPPHAHVLIQDWTLFQHASQGLVPTENLWDQAVSSALTSQHPCEHWAALPSSVSELHCQDCWSWRGQLVAQWKELHSNYTAEDGSSSIEWHVA